MIDLLISSPSSHSLTPVSVEFLSSERLQGSTDNVSFLLGCSPFPSPFLLPSFRFFSPSTNKPNYTCFPFINNDRYILIFNYYRDLFLKQNYAIIFLLSRNKCLMVHTLLKICSYICIIYIYIYKMLCSFINVIFGEANFPIF